MSTWVADFGARVSQRQELFVVGLIVLIVAMLIVPLPTLLVDALIASNIVLALMIFISTFYMRSIVEFASFPAILLVTTLFRLALSISTTRLILLQGDAGQIITTFGEFVVGDSLVVGVVIFAIVTIVQFIVITKGGERIAEVVARFSLDAMPGKQMSIDGDARAGTLDNAQVEAARRRIEMESQLHGAFDGAMKFVKGDAIAGMVIIVVNLVGGAAAGVFAHGTSLADAISTYSLLSIGDGLVAQIPALLISVGAGFVVTRVAGDTENLGQQMVSELFGQAPVLVICAVLALAMGLLPGFPFVVFALLAASLAGLFIYRRWSGTSRSAERTTGAHDPDAPADGSYETDPDAGMRAGELKPVVARLSHLEQGSVEPPVLAARLRNTVLTDLGIALPPVIVEFSADVSRPSVDILLHEVRAATIDIAFGRYQIRDFDDDPQALGIDCISTPAADALPHQDSRANAHEGTDADLNADDDGRAIVSWWVSADDRAHVEQQGFATIDAVCVLEEHFIRLVSRNIHELFGVQETKSMLDVVERTHPELLKETYRHLPMIRITEIFQRLLSERVPVRNTRLVIEAIALWAPREKDTLVLAEHVRGALSRTISERFLSRGERRVILVAPASEERIRAGIRQIAAGSFLQMPPDQGEAFVQAIGYQIARLRVTRIESVVLMCAVDVRRFVKKLVERRFPDLDVVSFAEVSDSVQVDIAASV